jgi:hypothetical protein
MSPWGHDCPFGAGDPASITTIGKYNRQPAAGGDMEPTAGDVGSILVSEMQVLGKRVTYGYSFKDHDPQIREFLSN